MKPKIRIEINGGLISYIVANCECEIQVIDRDLEIAGRAVDYDLWYADTVLPENDNPFLDDAGTHGTN